MSDTCFRPKGLCCSSSCSHPPECDHEGVEHRITPWLPVWNGGVVSSWERGAEWCTRCAWWLRETEPPSEALGWLQERRS